MNNNINLVKLYQAGLIDKEQLEEEIKKGDFTDIKKKEEWKKN